LVIILSQWVDMMKMALILINSVECYNFHTNIWTEFPAMTEARAFATAVVKYCWHCTMNVLHLKVIYVTLLFIYINAINYKFIYI
jgi:hypothetical protein